MRPSIPILTVVAVLAASLLARPAQALLPTANASGAALYQRECAPCHGASGRGDGPEAKSFAQPPRDLQTDFLDRYPENQHVKRIRHARLLLLPIDSDAVEQSGKQMADAIADHLQRLPEIDWPLVRRGADVYAERCESCHGPYAHPVASALPPVALPTGKRPVPDFQKALGDQDLLRIAQHDHPALLGFAPIGNDADAKDLLAYLRLLSPGFARYSLWCAPCHGDEGHGDGVYATDIDKPNVVFDRAYLKRQNPAELRRKLMHVVTQDAAVLPHYQRELTAGQARAVVAALRASREAMPAPSASVLPPGPLPAAPVQTAPAPAATPTPALGPSPTPRPKKSAAATSRAAKTPHAKKHAPTAKPHPTKTAPKKTKPKPKPKPTPAVTAP